MAEGPSTFDRWGAPLHKAWWPSPNDARYLLVFGIPPKGGVATWGIIELGKRDSAERLWNDRPKAVTRQGLTRWLESITGQPAASEMADKFADVYPDLFGEGQDSG